MSSKRNNGNEGRDKIWTGIEFFGFHEGCRIRYNFLICSPGVRGVGFKSLTADKIH